MKSTLKGKNLILEEQPEDFTLKVDPTEKGDKNEHGSVATSVASILLKKHAMPQKIILVADANSPVY